MTGIAQHLSHGGKRPSHLERVRTMQRQFHNRTGQKPKVLRMNPTFFLDLSREIGPLSLKGWPPGEMYAELKTLYGMEVQLDHLVVEAEVFRWNQNPSARCMPAARRTATPPHGWTAWQPEGRPGTWRCAMWGTMTMNDDAEHHLRQLMATTQNLGGRVVGNEAAACAWAAAFNFLERVPDRGSPGMCAKCFESTKRPGGNGHILGMFVYDICPNHGPQPSTTSARRLDEPETASSIFPCGCAWEITKRFVPAGASP